MSQIQWSGEFGKDAWQGGEELPCRRVSCPNCGEPFFLYGVVISTASDRVYALIPCPACRGEFEVKL